MNFLINLWCQSKDDGLILFFHLAVIVGVQELVYNVQEPAGFVTVCAALSGATLARELRVFVETQNAPPAEGNVV